MNKRPELDTTNPPGQIVNRPEETFRPPKYLRDVIIAAQDRSSERFPGAPATQPSPDVEKRLQALVGALESLVKGADQRGDYGWWAQELRKVLVENKA